MKRCDACEADVGPWEQATCPVLKRQRHPQERFNNADAAYLVLETSDVPLGVYDIGRGIAREVGKDVNRGSLNVSLANDRRFCWAGRGVYGLVRHGLVPGPRNLAGIGRFFIYSHGSAILLEQLAFAMKFAGYRFSTTSLTRAVADSPDIYWPTWTTCEVWRSRRATSELRKLGIAPNHQDFLALADRCQRMIAEGLHERRRRLRGS